MMTEHSYFQGASKAEWSYYLAWKQFVKNWQIELI